MDEFLDGFWRGLVLAGALIVLPALAVVTVIRLWLRPDGAERASAVYWCMTRLCRDNPLDGVD